MKVLIDPGHGIDTPGKRSPDGRFFEYLWNRQVADILRDNLAANGIDAEILVTETNDIPLRTRAMRANKVCNRVGVNNVLLVSVHANAAGMGDRWMNATGWSCYTTKGVTRSDRLADCLYKTFKDEFPEKRMRVDYSDGDPDIEEDFYIIKKTLCPAVLLENFFYDNGDECAWLLMEETKERVAFAATRGIIRYIDRYV